MLTRQSSALILDYHDRVFTEENYGIPNEVTCRAISSLLDDSFERAYGDTCAIMSQSPLVGRAITHIERNRTCGGFKNANRSLHYLTPFEQTFSLRRFLELHPYTQKPRTYAFFYSDDEIVPMWVKKPAKSSPTIWTTIVGSNSGALKAPSYEQMAQDGQVAEIFIDPLTTLEMHRNPKHIGALAIKAEAFDSNAIDCQMRYQNYNQENEAFFTASAELKRQKSGPTRSIVSQAAGFNLALLVEEDEGEDQSFLKNYNFEDFHPDGYRDDQHPKISALDILATLPEALRGDTQDLDMLTSQVLATRLGRSKIPEIFKIVSKSLFPDCAR